MSRFEFTQLQILPPVNSDPGQASTVNETPVETTPRAICTIAREIRRAWGAKVNYAARPYLDAMLSLDRVSDSFGFDSGKEIVLRFLGNASSFRGPDAKRLKDELKAIVGWKK